VALPSEAAGYTLFKSAASRSGYAGVKLRRHLPLALAPSPLAPSPLALALAPSP